MRFGSVSSIRTAVAVRVLRALASPSSSPPPPLPAECGSGIPVYRAGRWRGGRVEEPGVAWRCSGEVGLGMKEPGVVESRLEASGLSVELEEGGPGPDTQTSTLDLIS